ncbi:MAG: hypothetical protein NZ959_04340 [Armatimonadetes bacterium]|nr:hypothetical protein [Armatimonadota bacterium]MDW8121419.1 hypothetical protein [Armatimonadota bacterium]
MPEKTAVQIAIVFFALTLAGAFTALFWEVMTFVRGRSLISRRQWLWRVGGLIFLLCLLSLMFSGALLGRYYFQFSSPRTAALYWSVYLIIILIGVVFLILMALRDLRWLSSEEFARKVQLYQRLGEELKRLAKDEKSRDPSDDGRRTVDGSGSSPRSHRPPTDQP